MTATAKKEFPAWIILGIIVLVAAVLLVATNMLTADRIAEQSRAKAEAARISVMSGADSFEELAVPAGSGVDDCYAASAGGNVIGYTSQVTVKGYGGPIEIIVGVDTNGKVTAISVGGSDFKETAGLGAKVKDEAFTSQFTGVEAPIAIGGNVDAITGATISSKAVTSGVNTAVEYINSVR